MTWGCHDCGAANEDASTQCGSRKCQSQRAAMPTAKVSAPTPASPIARIGSKASRSKHQYSKGFLEFWGSYPRKKDKATAARAFDFAVRDGVDPQVMIAGAIAYDKDPQRNPDFTKHPATWINAHGWEDEIAASPSELADRRAQAEMERTRRDHLYGDEDAL